MSLSVCNQDTQISVDFGGKFSPYRKTRVDKVKKALFGPLDHEETAHFIKNQMQGIAEDACKRYNFNFQTGQPLDGGNWIWTSASLIRLNRKRMSLQVQDNSASEALYFQPIEPVSQNAESSATIRPLRKPQPNSAKVDDKKQSLITDYMQQSRITTSRKKKSNNNIAPERAQKVAKLLGDCSS